MSVKQKGRSSSDTAELQAAITPAGSLAERYTRMAHEGFERRAVDPFLRAFDAAISGTMLVLTSPIMAIAALAIYADSGRPALYRGRRVGRAGRIFTMYKFRTLELDAESRLGPYLGAQLTDLTNAEVTRVGKWL